jgi:hypothetical protein
MTPLSPMGPWVSSTQLVMTSVRMTLTATVAMMKAWTGRRSSTYPMARALAIPARPASGSATQNGIPRRSVASPDP